MRTLVVGKRVLTQEESEQIQRELYDISISEGDKEAREQALFARVENKLDMLGITAIEDRLQEGVPEAIESMMEANIKLWVLTGDKKETAQEVGKLCRLVQQSMQCLDLVEKQPSAASLRQKLKTIPHSAFYVIIDGLTLATVLSEVTLAKEFFTKGLQANSVICCRVSPKQKSEVVKLAKQHANAICVAIGDGANDVPMIMEASIGVGIKGKEGTQAVRNSDYAIGKFRFLVNLLFVHGRWGYRRLSGFVCYYFYKNIITVVTQFSFTFYNGFSGMLFFPDVLPLAYNAIFSSWPCTFCYCFEKDVTYEQCLKYPILYKAGQKKYYLNIPTFWRWICFALIHGVTIFFGVVTVFA